MEKVDVGALQKLFPQGGVPRSLLRLAQFQNEAGDQYNEDFYVTADASAVTWFDGDKSIASQFIPFAQKFDGSMFAFWQYTNQPLDQCPVVFLDSDSGDNSVLANNFREFLGLLGIGTSLPYLVPLEDLAAHDKPRDISRFREWLRTEFFIEPVGQIAEALARARTAHPSLSAFVNEWSKNHVSSR